MSTRNIVAVANGLMASSDPHTDTLNGGCCWTSDPSQAACFVTEDEAEAFFAAHYPLVHGWIETGEVVLRSLEGAP